MMKKRSPLQQKRDLCKNTGTVSVLSNLKPATPAEESFVFETERANSLLCPELVDPLQP